ncbi:Co-chaperone Hsc20 [Metarhizium album ARSEF 1941]|uniref:Co-chaperone Hsc20 n=1 Tax=Metarhizium album (strain ARSEF 1941) TaxID=1081103 RepID=A0A0B2X3B0_METAS|nr:Co-chaperone Hsc20 [Metarhizium album ARSEF 1941]KHN99909.1 Co-chaperone Hsc20 [Metarhizium album ARSEF 1941]
MRAVTSATQRRLLSVCSRCRPDARTTPSSPLPSRAALQHPAPTRPPHSPARQTRRFAPRPRPRPSPQPDGDSSTTTTTTTPPRPHETVYSLFPQTLPDGPPPAGHFPVDLRSLRAEFLRLQARHHPDLHPASSKAQAEAASAAVNEAYRTLSNPLLRAQYLLALQGVDVANDETLKVAEPDLLAVVLDAHETIERARRPADLDALAAENEERIRTCETVLERAFREHDLDAAKREAVRLRYWVNVRGAVADWADGKPTVLQH